MDGAGPKYFLALWPDEVVREAICDWRDAWVWNARATPVRTERLHLTVHFLGSQSAAVIDELDRALRLLPPFACELAAGQAALWHHGIAVLEVAAVPVALDDLHRQTGVI